MNINLVLILLCASTMPFHSSFCQNNKNPTDSIIIWGEDIKLKWQDFQGRNNPSSQDGAATCGEIEIVPVEEKISNLTYVVYNRFIKTCSWVKDTSIIFSQALLEHEQLHFDIAEVYARKIRCLIKSFNEKSAGFISPEFSAEIEIMFAERNETGGRYDKETSHGTILDKQKEWNARIEKELRELQNCN